MSQVHVCRPGECLDRVAWRYLLEPKAVSSHPDNRELLAKRKDPSMLFPGDKLTIPQGREPSFTVATGQHHRLVVHPPRKELRLVVKDELHEPVANASYKLTLDDVRPEKRKRSGTTDGQGMLRERIPLKCMSALLEIADWRIRLRLGYLHPLPAGDDDPASGVESRLRALGYAAGHSGRPRPGQTRMLPADTRLALAIFQTDAGLDATGDVDNATLDKLKQGYGC
jgi:Putative peptidoglycan binding domain